MSPRGTADLAVERGPVERDIGELAVVELDPSLGKVRRVRCRRSALVPVQPPVALDHGELVQRAAAPHQPRERLRVEQLVADDEIRARDGLSPLDAGDAGLRNFRAQRIDERAVAGSHVHDLRQCAPAPAREFADEPAQTERKHRAQRGGCDEVSRLSDR
jgi:hypothetical protein